MTHEVFALCLLVRMDGACLIQKCSVYYVCLGFIVFFKPCFAIAGKYLQEMKNKDNSPSM